MEVHRDGFRQAGYVPGDIMLETIAAPKFTLPMTVTRTTYKRLRGQYKAKVVTIRFNLIAGFNVSFMIKNVMAELEKYFNPLSNIACSIGYDFVLAKRNADPPSFYVWVANTNRAVFDNNNEIMLQFTHANINRFCQSAANVHVPDLEIDFHSSDCVIDRLLTVVFSFVFWL